MSRVVAASWKLANLSECFDSVNCENAYEGKNFL